MLSRLLGWLGCSIVGGLAVTLSLSNGLPDKSKAKLATSPAAKEEENKEAAASPAPASDMNGSVRNPLPPSKVGGGVSTAKN